jgi:hypothetical protein
MKKIQMMAPWTTVGMVNSVLGDYRGVAAGGTADYDDADAGVDGKKGLKWALALS